MNELPFPEATSTFGDTLVPCNSTLDCSVSSNGSRLHQGRVVCLRLLSSDDLKYCSCRSVILGWYSGEFCEDSSPLMYFAFFVEFISGIFALYQTFGFIALALQARSQRSTPFTLFCILETVSSALNILWQTARTTEHILPSGAVANHYSVVTIYIFGPIAFTTMQTGAILLVWSWYNTVLSTWTFSGKMKGIKLLTYLSTALCAIGFLVSVSTVRVGLQAPSQIYLLTLLVAIGINFYIIRSVGKMVSSALSHGYGKINPDLFDLFNLFRKSLRWLLRYLYGGFLIYFLGLGVSSYASSLYGDSLTSFVPLLHISFTCVRIAGFMMRQGLLRNGRGIVTKFAVKRVNAVLPTKSVVLPSQLESENLHSAGGFESTSTRRQETVVLESGSIASEAYKVGTIVGKRTTDAREAHMTNHKNS